MLNQLRAKGKQKLAKENYVGLPARQSAVRLLTAVLQEHKPLDQFIGRYGSRGPMQNLVQRDKAFARMIAATALRRFGQINHVLGQFLEKPLPEKCGSLREILFAGTAQLLFLESQPHAVINLAVRQCQLDRQARRFDKLVNAVLRRVAQEGPAIVAEQDELVLNTPDWLRDRWTAIYGEEATRRIAAAHLTEAALDLSVKHDPNGWADRLGGIVLPTGTVRLVHKGRIEKIDGYEGGHWWVQDAAAALPVKLLGNIRGMRIADLCAAPGGKTAQLAQGHASVVAVDNSPVRLDRLKENLARLNLEAETIEMDVLDWRPRELFDAVVLDAPCTATGTIRRHPDIPLLKQPEDLEELADQQRKLLNHAIKLVKPGGALVYCTCSLEPEEGIDQIRGILSTREDWKLEPIATNLIGGKVDWLYGGCLRTFPYDMSTGDPETSGLDGFFAARLRRL